MLRNLLTTLSQSLYDGSANSAEKLLGLMFCCVTFILLLLVCNLLRIFAVNTIPDRYIEK